MNAVADSFNDSFIDGSKVFAREQLDQLEADFVELAKRHHDLRRREPAMLNRGADSPEAAELASMARILTRLGDEIQIRKLNQRAPARVSIVNRAG